MSEQKEGQIQVAIRIRPLLQEENKHGNSKLKIDKKTNTIITYKEKLDSQKGFRFDTIIDPYDSQADVFHKTKVHNIILKALDGFNATIFAYGQTSMGKTFTMEGYRYILDRNGRPIPELMDDSNIGISPRVIKRLFAQIYDKEDEDPNFKYVIKLSFCQIYREKIHDLLDDSQYYHDMTSYKRLNPLKLKWKSQDVYEVENLYTFEVESEEEAVTLFYEGVRNKKMASNKLNKASSRSHTIFTINVERVNKEDSDDIVKSKLQLVDLAGSERLTYASKNKALNKECIEINKSLFTLRQVITSLSDKIVRPGKSNQIIPYRESKLTCLLKQSLGGNSYCLMIACIAPCDLYIDDNINTLVYASKAQVISNIPKINEDPKMKKMRELEMHVKYLSSQLSIANNAIKLFKKDDDGEQEVPNTDSGMQGPSIKVIHDGSHRSNTLAHEADASSEISANFYSNRSIDQKYNFDKPKRLTTQENEKKAKEMQNLLNKVKECLALADEVQKVNAQKDLELKQEKAKVVQLNLELEKANNKAATEPRRERQFSRGGGEDNNGELSILPKEDSKRMNTILIEDDLRSNKSEAGFRSVMNRRPPKRINKMPNLRSISKSRKSILDTSQNMSINPSDAGAVKLYPQVTRRLNSSLEPIHTRTSKEMTNPEPYKNILMGGEALNKLRGQMAKKKGIRKMNFIFQ
ncbi:unnamed protein product [Moneuplotes crassus]|uniref:Kinesin-like protein n=1 Tax=Euplotes crassus TaxID=5936 RepID=A0AAD1XZ96_EUPCR|nr:unnamed protein product [Moneuplotes crassus]